MAGIAGIANPEKRRAVEKIIDRISYRGQHIEIVPLPKAIFGVVYNEIESIRVEQIQQERLICDEVADGHFACAKFIANTLSLSRDPLGVAPLYYGRDAQGDLCFASEVKGLLSITRDINELPPGSRLANNRLETIQSVKPQKNLNKPTPMISAELRALLTEAVKKRIQNGPHLGSLLSGGLDSSVIAAIARPFVEHLDTFASGLKGSPDLLHARQAAKHLNTRHHERVVCLDEMLRVLPDVIYHLESFDAPLVRSSILHYLTVAMASDYVPTVFSGEGSDELFAGYAYLKQVPLESLSEELVRITNHLHNTALQRVDRCTMAHGVIPLVPFLDPQVVTYAMQIPNKLKVHQGIEKWILRQTVADLLPRNLVERPKCKFWEGAGVDNHLAEYAEKAISDADFKRERWLPNNWKLKSKEELFYYRIFKERFGLLKNLDWMGRTKGFPEQ